MKDFDLKKLAVSKHGLFRKLEAIKIKTQHEGFCFKEINLLKTFFFGGGEGVTSNKRWK